MDIMVGSWRWSSLFEGAVSSFFFFLGIFWMPSSCSKISISFSLECNDVEMQWRQLK